jgi:vacuolar protein sorting-associated protein 16
VEECIKAMQHREAAKYIQKCDPAVRPGLFIKIGDFKAAGQEALALKDIQLLRFVLFRLFIICFIISFT